MIRSVNRTNTRSLLSSPAVTIALLVCVLAAGAVAYPASAHAHTVARGLADYAFTDPGVMTSDQQAAALHEINSQLGASSVRFFVSWADAQPQQGIFSPVYMEKVASAVALARQEGLRVMITFRSVPKWASNSAYWTLGTLPKGYKPNVAIDKAHLTDFQMFSRAVATQFRGQVYAYEAWNEPNLYLDIFPQSTAQDRYYGAHLYVSMLRKCSAGVRAGDPGALVVAGGTSPRGSLSVKGRQYATTPQRFAKEIKAAGVSAYFDAYSHHPYVPGASPQLWPEAPPRDTSTTVTLQNLGVLLKLFPSKPFFLTEYGYQTEACQSFTGQHVDEITQATYLKRAYAYAARYPQVKLMMWFLLKDYRPTPDPYLGFYTGLRTADGSQKRAWFAFAGGNGLTLTAPGAIASGETLTLEGVLSCASVGGLAGKPLVVERRSAGGSWSTVKTVTSGGDGLLALAGTYSIQLQPRTSAYYRVSWRGVVTSPTRFVKVQ